VVTGAGGGIGAVIAAQLARLGSHVYLLDLEGAPAVAAEIEPAQGGSTVGIDCDVTDPEAVEKVADRLAEDGRPCDILVNNAALVRLAALEEIALEDWRAVMAVNIDGCFICTQTFGRTMLEREGGSIVNIASVAALNPSPGRAAYPPSKAAMVAFTRQAAVEWGPKRVRVNAICPGLVDSSMKRPGSIDARRRKRTFVPLGRLADPQDIANAVAFLAGDGAAYVSGAVLAVDGAISQIAFRDLNAAPE
jgi:NAD(P)-dependent dehydrogenase (short-subunit alcohol dehydrogenase family)